jgi:hypothetical protein
MIFQGPSRLLFLFYSLITPGFRNLKRNLGMLVKINSTVDLFFRRHLLGEKIREDVREEGEEDWTA